jgi:flagellar protein FliJ
MFNLGDAGMEQSETNVLRRKQFEASEKETKVALLRTMIGDFDSMIGQLEEQIAAEEERTRIKDPRHPAYSMFAKAAANRHHNLLISVAHTPSMFEAAKLELDQVTEQLHDLEPTHDNQLSAA